MKVRLSVIIVVVLLFMFTVSCNSTQSYTGESENWKGTIYVTQNIDKEVGTLLYKGKDRKTINRVKWKVESMHGAKSGDEEVKNGTIKINGVCTGCSPQGKEEPYEVTIEWNGNIETFRMESR